MPNSPQQPTAKELQHLTSKSPKRTYIDVVTYKGSAYYNKASKKVKVIIKPGFKTISKGSKNKAMVKKNPKDP